MAGLTGKTRLAGVIGWPVSHSRSPRLHNYWLSRYGIDGAYVPLPVAPNDFECAVAGLRAAGFAGANVTIPHKQAAYALCNRVDDAAKKSGSVNTLIFHADGIEGKDTDGYGFLENIRAHGVDIFSGQIVVIGAGGAGRAVIANLTGQGASVAVVNRSRAKAEALATEIPSLTVVDWEDRHVAAADATLLINATSAGMEGYAALDMDLRSANTKAAVADLIYTPPDTPFLKQAAELGLVCVGGLGMLLHQACPGFNAWFGQKPVVDQETWNYMLPPKSSV